MFTDEEFIQAWLEVEQNGKPQASIAEKFGISRQYVDSHAQHLRKKGVRLPELRRGSQKSKHRPELTPDRVAELNKLIGG
jgi:biotin operon repressor